MSNVASLDLCKELHKLSGWDNTLAGGRDRWVLLPDNSWDLLRLGDVEANGLDKRLWFRGIPAYDLGFMLRKLPKTLKHPATGEDWTIGIDWHITKKKWLADYGRTLLPHAQADTPEDAACKLLCELIRQEVVKV